MKNTMLLRATQLLALCLATVIHAADSQVSSWLTTYWGKYVRIYTNDTMKANGTTITTWSNGQQTQSLPAYCGVQQILTSSNYLYVRSTGLGSHIMGPWWNNAAHTVMFVNLPANQKMIYRIPRTPTVPASKSSVQGEAGMTVDGVRIFDAGDAFSYSNSNLQDATAGNNLGQGDGVWNREAWSNEGMTMDAAYAHQQNTGRYHYHAGPIALRYLLGDHVDFNSTTKVYSESTNAPTKHSPIIGWIQDGFPLYGPYGYSSASNAASGIHRMISGYVTRDGTSGSIDLNSAGRHTLPAWAGRLGRTINLSASQYGPNVSTTYPVGHYIEDYEYLGDLGKTQGVDFDLDEYNGRWCVTPEFPNGTYAYFATISSNGTPIYPYNTGRQYYGTPSGGLVTSINENVATNFSGGPDAALTMSTPKVNGGNVTLVWSATEGGTYRVESTTNFSTWTTNTTNATASGNTGSYTNSGESGYKFFKVTRTALANYDPVSATTSGGGGTIFNVPGGTMSRSSVTNITLSITLPTNPPQPPAGAPITSVTLGSLTATSSSYDTQGTVLANFTITTNNISLGAQNVVVTFNMGPPPYTFTGGLTVIQ